MNSIQISIEATEEQQEILIGKLNDFDAIGFEQTATHLIAYFNEENFKSYDINEVIKGYDFVTATIKEKNWNEEWESNFQPVIVNNFCAVRADFHQPITNVTHEIIITPKMSFGTGHHATTYMMIEQMQQMDLKNKKVFDFGTGTGILSILAEKLGAASISAIDIDEWSITNTLENIERNNCSRILVTLSSQIPEEHFNIILANINKNVILQYSTQFKNILLANGSLLLSGLLADDEQEIIETFAKEKFSLIKKISKENWLSLLLTYDNI